MYVPILSGDPQLKSPMEEREGGREGERERWARGGGGGGKKEAKM